jgi:hypothetical protein
MYGILQTQLNSSLLHSDKHNSVVSPLIENGSLPVENHVMHSNSDSDNNLLLPPATTIEGGKIDEDGFEQSTGNLRFAESTATASTTYKSSLPPKLETFASNF